MLSEINLSVDQMKIFLLNLEQKMQENWISKMELARRLGVSITNLSVQIQQLREGRHTKISFLNKIALILDSTLSEMIEHYQPLIRPSASELFIQNAIKDGAHIDKIARKTGITVDRLKNIFNRGINRLKIKEIYLILHAIDTLNIPIIVPFAAKSVDIITLAHDFKKDKNLNHWAYQRKAIQRIIREQKISIDKLSKETAFSRDQILTILGEGIAGKTVRTVPPPAENDWLKVLSTLKITREIQDYLITIGKYSLTLFQATEMLKLISNYQKYELGQDGFFCLYVALKHIMGAFEKSQWESQIQQVINRIKQTI